MGEYTSRDKAKATSGATAGPSADDRFGSGLVGQDLRSRVLSVSITKDRTRVVMSLGKMQGVHVGMEGYIRGPAGILSELQIDAVEDRRCHAFVDATPDQLAHGSYAMLNPSWIPRQAITEPVRARVIGMSVDKEGTRITISRGASGGVTSGTRGRLHAADGTAGHEIMIDSVTARQASAVVHDTPDYVQRYSVVELLPRTASAAAPIQRRASGNASALDVQATGQAGVAGANERLPHFDTIQRAFGKHDVSGVRAQVGGAATAAAAALGAGAYATGNRVAFGSSPALHTAAHEAAHAVQQRNGAVGFQGLGAAGDEHERHADKLADKVVAGESAASILDEVASVGARDETQHPGGAVQRKPDPTMDRAPPTPQPESEPPSAHGSHEIKVEFGGGSITGGITATLEYGKVGTPVGNEHLKMLKNTAAVQINGFVTKLETAVLNGEAELEMLDGVKISVEANLMNVGSDGMETEVDLLQVALKLVGDVGHWLNAGPNVALTIDGRIAIALGGKLAAKLAKVTAAHLEQKFLAKEMSAVGSMMDNNLRSIEKLERQLLSPDLTPRLRTAIKEEVLQHRLQVSTGKRQLEGLTKSLQAARGKATAAIQRLQGKLARQVARAMEHKAVAFVATKLAKLVPVLNAISMIVDVVDLIRTIRAIIKGGDRGDGGDAEKPQPTGNSDVGPPADGNSPRGDRSRAPGTQRPPLAVADARAVEAARRRLSPAAQRIIAAVTHRGFGAGPELDADQITALGASIPPDLQPREIEAVIARLAEDQTRATSAESVFAAINAAVRQVRSSRRTVTIDGVAGPDLGDGALAGEGPVTTPSQVDGSISDAGPAPGGPTKARHTVSDAMRIVQDLPPPVVGQWFDASTGSLALNDTGRQWMADHVGRMISARTMLVSLTPSIRSTSASAWILEVAFELRSHGAARRVFVRHSFSVSRDEPVLGARVGELAFEPFADVTE